MISRTSGNETDVSSTRDSPNTITSPSTVTTTTTTTPVSTVTTTGTTSGSTDTTIDTTSGSIVTTKGTTPSVNVTTTPASHLPNTMGSGAAIGIAIGVILVIVACVLVVYFLRKTGRLKCLTVRGRTRRSSTSSSRHPLEPDESEAGDTLPRLTEGDMFAIADHDDDYKDAGGATEDGYFYDEVFGSSAFEDETTKASNKDLFSATDTDSIPDLLLRVDRITFN